MTATTTTSLTSSSSNQKKKMAKHKNSGSSQMNYKKFNNNKSTAATAAVTPSSESEPTASTRVCIKGVPPSFSSIQLRDFLVREYKARQQHTKNHSDDHDSNLVVTDCRVLFHNKDNNNKMKQVVSRRMAFAGFQTTEMAQRVISLFDKSFALTSRLSVEPAESKKSNKQEAKPASTTTDKEPKSSNNKQDRETKEIVQELVATVGTNKAKFWANDLFEPPTSAAASSSSTKTKEIADQLAQQISGGNQKGDDDDSDDSSSTSSSDDEEKQQKQKRQRDNDDDDDDEDDNSSRASSSSSEDDDADPLANAKPNISVVSDMDFLRSKQKMVNDLEENVEDAKEQEKVAKEPDGGSDDSSTSSSDDDDSSSTSSTTPAPKLVSENVTGETIAKVNEATHDNNKAIDPYTKHDVGSDEEEEDNEAPNNRLFVRNLPFTTTEQDLEEHFSSFGSILECHIPVDDQKMSKGFAFITFENAFDASRAKSDLDGTDFQGRFIHILLSRQKPKTAEEKNGRSSNVNIDDRPLSYKERQELARRQDASKSSKGWSASFVRGDAVVDSLADRLGIKKGDILNVKGDLKSGDAAVRLALGETQVIEENREYFKRHGIDMEALVSVNPTSSKEGGGHHVAKRSDTSILVKNLPYDTLVEDLQKLFHSVGDPPKRILLPPSRTIALVEYGHSSDAKRAFRRLAYRRFKSVPLYLEWAPLAAAMNPSAENAGEKEEGPEAKVLPDADDDFALEGPTPSIYIKNLNFSTTEEQLKKVFEKHASDIRAVNIPKKLAPLKKAKVGGGKKAEEMQSLSMGFGFVEFASQESANKVLKKLQGTFVDGHALELKPSTKSLTTKPTKPPASTKKNPTKLVVRNVPFQATRTELLKLFGSFGQLKRIRVPKKFDGGHRGFAFVEFVTSKEALAAMKALSRTHLYGRHLVLEWAEDNGEGDTTGGLAALRDKAQKDVTQAPNKANKRQRLS